MPVVEMTDGVESAETAIFFKICNFDPNWKVAIATVTPEYVRIKAKELAETGVTVSEEDIQAAIRGLRELQGPKGNWISPSFGPCFPLEFKITQNENLIGEKVAAGFSDTVTIDIDSGGPKGDVFDFAEHMRLSLMEWYHGMDVEFLSTKISRNEQNVFLVVFDFPAQPSLGIKAHADTVVVGFKNGRPGGEEDDFKEHICMSLSNWYR